MIKVNFKYSAKFPKKMKNGRSMFQITDFDSKNPKDPNYITVFVNNDVEVLEGEKVKILNMVGFGVSHYNGKMQVTLSADIEIVTDDGETNTGTTKVGNTSFNTGKPIDLSEQDLPF